MACGVRTAVNCTRIARRSRLSDAGSNRSEARGPVSLPGRRLGSVLRLQPRGRHGVRTRHCELVATGSALAHYEGIKAFCETDQTEDLKAIMVPALVLQGDDDQVGPYKDAAIKQHELLSNSELKIYEGYPHGMLTTHADVINPGILAFIQG